MVRAVSAPAAAPLPDVAGWDYGGSGIGVSDHHDGAAGQGGGDGGGSSGPARQLYVYWSVGWTDAGFCRVRHVTTDPDLAAAYNYALQRELAAANANGSTAMCPPTAGAAATPPTAGELAKDFWDVRLLPSPQLKIEPGYAITGKRVYLQIGGGRQQHFDVNDPLGAPIAIDATSTYVIDWGDGAVESTTSNGGPWPSGDVTHVYTTAAPQRTITVTQQWSATWQGGGQQGALDNLRTQGGLTFEVTQVQAVRG